jgi:hypothetical protein
MAGPRLQSSPSGCVSILKVFRTTSSRQPQSTSSFHWAPCSKASMIASAMTVRPVATAPSSGHETLMSLPWQGSFTLKSSKTGRRLLGILLIHRLWMIVSPVSAQSTPSAMRSSSTSTGLSTTDHRWSHQWTGQHSTPSDCVYYSAMTGDRSHPATWSRTAWAHASGTACLLVEPTVARPAPLMAHFFHG